MGTLIMGTILCFSRQRLTCDWLLGYAFAVKVHRGSLATTENVAIIYLFLNLPQRESSNISTYPTTTLWKAPC